MKFEIYVEGKLYMTCFNSFVAMNNTVSLRAKYGKENVTVKVEE